jgi:outer membrane protein, heavy metal efflux system
MPCSTARCALQRAAVPFVVWLGILSVFAGCNGPERNAAVPTAVSFAEKGAVPDERGPESGSVQQVRYESRQPAVKKKAPAGKSSSEAASTKRMAGSLSGLSLPELLMLAVENNPRLAAARTKAAAHGWKVPQVTSLDDPMVSSTVFLDAIETAAGAQNAALSISQKFPWFGKLRLRGEIASADAQALGWEAESVRIQVIEQVQLAYFDLAYLIRAHEVLTKLEPKIESVITITRTRFRTENDPKKRIGFEAVLQAEVELYRLRTRLAEIEESRKRAEARLKELLNRPQDEPLAVRIGKKTAGNEDRKVPANLTPLLAIVDRCQPELLARMWNSQRDAAGIALSRKNYYPDLTAGLNWYGISNSGLSRVANGDDAVALTFGVNVPIYGERLRAAESEAELRYSASRHRQLDASNRFRSEVAALHAQARAHDRVLKILKDNVIRRARRSLDLSIQSWRQDRIEFQRVIDSYKELVRFELEILQRERSKNRALASLERAIGCAVESWADNAKPRGR